MSTNTIPQRTEVEARIRELLATHGPMVGKEILEHLGDASSMIVWKVCRSSPDFRFKNAARYYLRYDITRENQLRLSPSILRNFMSFTLVHLADQSVRAVERAILLSNLHRVISLKKLQFARQAILALSPEIRNVLRDHACAFIAGDISYYLAHDEPRRVNNTDFMVKGSDIDIVFVHTPEVSADLVRAAEAEFTKIKYKYLKDPAISQEIDFIFKPISKMIDQLSYGTIVEKIASKILYESSYLFGSLEMYDAMTKQLVLFGTEAKIDRDFETALRERQETIRKIFKFTEGQVLAKDPEVQSLFYFSQERLEFE